MDGNVKSVSYNKHSLNTGFSSNQKTRVYMFTTAAFCELFLLVVPSSAVVCASTFGKKLQVITNKSGRASLEIFDCATEKPNLY